MTYSSLVLDFNADDAAAALLPLFDAAAEESGGELELVDGKKPRRKPTGKENTIRRLGIYYHFFHEFALEEEEYGTVSALLAERAKPFLGLPSGPLQVGHFIGALGIILMAFVEYPGFPLTNLPTPIRDALAGGTYNGRMRTF